MITATPQSHLRIKMPRARPLHVRGILLCVVLSAFAPIVGCGSVVIGNVGTCGPGKTLCGTVCVVEQTDSNNCGACGLACAGTCALGRCLVTLAAQQEMPDFIAADSTSVYWTNNLSGTVIKAPLVGGSTSTLASAQESPEFVAVSAGSVYWTTHNGNTTNKGNTVVKLPITGGTPETLSSGRQPFGMTVGSSVYWTTLNGIVLKTPLDGGESATLVPEASTGFGNGPQGIAVDTTDVYWALAGFCTGDGCTGSILRVPLDGGKVVTLAYPQAYPESIAVDSTRVYWSNYQIGTVMSVAKDGGTPATLASGQGEPDFIALDETSVYWTTGASGSVMKAPLGGGESATLASGQATPRGIVVDETSVYWTNYTGGTVTRLSPK